MTNRLRTEVEEEEPEKELVVEEKPKEISDNALWQLFQKNFSAEKATASLPFLFFLAFLGMLYIGNMHLAEKNIRDIDKLSKETNELGWEYKITKAKLAHISTLTEVKKRADSLAIGVKESVEPPQKLKFEEVKDEH